MDAAAQAAQKAADTLTQTTLGAVAVLLAIAVVCILVYFFRRLDGKDAIIQRLQDQRVEDYKLLNEKVEASLDKVALASEALKQAYSLVGSRK